MPLPLRAPAPTALGSANGHRHRPSSDTWWRNEEKKATWVGSRRSRANTVARLGAPKRFRFINFRSGNQMVKKHPD
jgi:hypothetical protein